MTIMCPISAALQSDLRQHLRRSGHVCWQDRDGCPEQGEPLGGAFASGSSQPGSMEVRGIPSC